ncbi:MAG: peptidoglycan editing factor PgeF [Chloroflexia bacterium]|nr:peptidoglycan editing factor PgeF [Chloroflexia bacterium]
MTVSAAIGATYDLDLPILRSALLSSIPGVVHGFTRRLPGLGRADGNVGYSPPRDKEDAWAMRQAWSAAIGVDPLRLVTAGQIHGNAVLQVGTGHAGVGARPDSGRLGLGDALVTNEPGPVLFSLHADCLPLLLVDPGGPSRGLAVAAVHAGWRGTVADVAGEAVRTMTAAFGSRPEEVLACIGPTIAACCYEVGNDVADAWMAVSPNGGAALTAGGGHLTFDLVRANAFQLEQAGLSPRHIERTGECTRCSGGAWFSHRGQGPTTGRFAAVIALEG